MAQQVASIRKEIAEAEGIRNDFNTQAAELAPLLAHSPGEELKAIQAEIDAGIAEQEARIAQLREKLEKLEQALPQPEKPKWSKENHPAFRKEPEAAPTEEKQVVLKSGDLVEAKWTDRLWYKAKISMVIGSSTNPQYTVRFVDYQDSSLTVDRSQIRPLASDPKKRKLDSTASVGVNPPTLAKSPAVISGAAQVDPEAARNARAAGKTLDEGSDKPAKKSRKIASSKALETGKAKWQNWQTKGPKGVKKDSMFRTGTAPNARVGFTGSGHGMTRDAARKRNVYRPELEVPEDDSRL